MSKLEVDKVIPQSGTTLTIGDSGDTTNIVGTLQNNGSSLVGDISSVVAGTNLSGGGTSGDVTLNLADASTSAKGAASFSSDNFAASSGAVTIKDAGIATAEIQDDAVTADKLANSINAEITANTAKTTNATHSGEVTGSGALTIADNIVDEANLKVSNSPTNGYMLTAQSGNTGGMTWAEAPSGGLTEVDCFGLNNINVASFTSYTLTSANTTRLSGFSGTTFTKTGTGISIDSNGLVTFPSTGTYFVRLSGVLNFLDGQNAAYFGATILGTNNGATGGLADRAFSAGIAMTDGTSTTNHAQAIVTLLWTVGNTSNDKVNFKYTTSRNSSNIRLYGAEPPKLISQFTILKVAG